ncbi:MAG TPA: DNA N-6-adenine-methyltransferase [Tepidisphaeraceae bacterium]|nr:DNA N-6-adenine-methyltransferase [Tepidisphaeraceae bacterium]
MSAGRNVVSLSQNWCTPPKYVTAVRKVFGGNIELDPCSNRHSVVNSNVAYRLPDHDGLKCNWDYESIFVNPPYGADRERGTTIKDWLRKCQFAHASHNAEVLALIPVATNTRHWKLYVWGAATGIAFLYDTRLKFLVDGQDGGKGAPMSCAMVYWGCKFELFDQVFLPYGAVVDIRNLREKTMGFTFSKSHMSLFAG